MTDKPTKILRISTIPDSLNTFCRGQLQWLREQGFDVVAVSSPGAQLDELAQREGVRTVAVPMERRISLWRDLKSLVAMTRVMRRERPTIVHSMTPKAGLVSMMAARLAGVPVRMHTYTGLVFPTATGVKQRILIATDRLLCACATYVNPEGRGVASDLQRYGITRKPLHIIGNGNVRGVDLEHWQRTAAMPQPQAGEFRFVMVGRLVGDKGINELIEAFVQLQREFPQVRLTLVGPTEQELDPLKPETLAEIERNPAIDAVGRQSDVRPYYTAAHAFVFPSYREGFPNTVLEAGAMGLPSIVTDINGCNEIIDHEVNGLIVPPRDTAALLAAMRRLVADPALAARLAGQARPLVAARFEQKALWAALLATYQQQLTDIIAR